MDRAIADRKAVGDTRITVGRVGIGVIVREGARIPDVTGDVNLHACVVGNSPLG